MKFWHVVVMEGYKTLKDTKCLSVHEAKDLFVEMKEKYPAPQYQVSKDYY